MMALFDSMTGAVLTIIPVVLFTTSVFLYKRNNNRTSKANKLIFSGTMFVFVLLVVAYIVSDYFTGVGINEAVIYHIRYGLRGAGFLEYWKIMAVSVALIFLGGSFSLWVSFSTKYDSDTKTKKCKNNLAYSFLICALLVNPFTFDIVKVIQSRIEASTPSFYQYYNPPRIIKTKDSSYNFVFIYAESLERTYFDEVLFPGLINGLRELESTSISFVNIDNSFATSWTIAGMVASQCGIPLFTPSHGNSMVGMDTFLDGAVCLGDLLSQEDYKLIYMGGADLNFAGKGKFYATHSFDEVLGRKELSQKLSDKKYQTRWGLYDDFMFENAFERFMELSDSEENFGMFLLTLDTHHTSGSPSKSCKNIRYRDGSNPILNAVACSDYLISDFVNDISESPYADNTVIVIASDHLAMRNTAYDQLKTKKRKNLFMVIDPSGREPVKITARGTTLDVGPTLLTFLGFEGKLGLGRNLINNVEESLISQFENYVQTLKSWRSSISTFWGFPKIKKKIVTNILARKINIDDRSFYFPVLVEFDNQLQTTLRFEFFSSENHKKLIDHVYDFDIDTPFVWIDSCSNVRKFDDKLTNRGFCMVAGKLGSDELISIPLARDMQFTTESLKWIINAETYPYIFKKRQEELRRKEKNAQQKIKTGLSAG